MKIVLIVLAIFEVVFASEDINLKIESLQKQIDALKETKKQEQSEYEISFPGQYRINFYSVENDRAGEDTQNAARARIRQNVDIEFSDQLSSSIRFQLNHTNDNVTNANDTAGNGVQIRHGYIAYKPFKEIQLRAGLVPVEEYHHDLLYSKGWGYNPFALEGFHNFDTFALHYFVASLREDDETTREDDIIQYQADLFTKPNTGTKFTLSTTLLDVNEIPYSGKHLNIALNLNYKLSEHLDLDTDILYSSTQKSLFSHGKNAEGLGFLAKLKYQRDGFSSSLLVTHMQGDDEGRGFLVPMSFTKTNSYWGYTGIVTVMPQTDTGFDGDSIHVSNNGYGMSSVQLNASYKVNDTTKLYGAFGWFGNTDAPQRGSDVAIDSVVMTQLRLHKYLGLDLGVAYARIYDGLSGYSKGVIGQTNLNNAQNETRDKLAFYGRLQLEF
ncbi:MAG: hypothetical protein J7J31_08205 [Helicobacteraceae bacterium]|nr:hypothetical protein [Helicobacteraceae bacterium]